MKSITTLFRLFAFSVLPLCGLAQDAAYVAGKTIPLTGNGSYDYAYIDQQHHILYAAHGTEVNVVDLRSEKQVAVIGNMGGVHGIAVAGELNRGFISDGKGNAVIAFDTRTYKTIKVIPITGKDADAIIYDPYSKKVLVFEGDENAAVIVDPKGLTEMHSVKLAGAPEFAASNGKGLIFNNLEDKSSLNVIDARTWKVIRNYSLSPCGGPTGLAIDKEDQRLFTVCRENKGMSVIDLKDGKVVQTLPIGAGVDAVVYDAENKRVIVSNGDGTASVFKQHSPDSYSLLQTLKTQVRAKTMAMDQSTHKLYFPVADFQPGTRTVVPGSFRLLVFKPQ